MTTFDKVIAAYIKLRDKKTELGEKHKEEMAAITAPMERLANWLQRELIAAGQESARTQAGTAFMQSEASCTVQDWTQTLKWIQEHDEWDMLEARVSKTAVRDYLAQNNELPPGVNYTEAKVVRVRR